MKEKLQSEVKDFEPHRALFAKENGLYFHKKILNNIAKYPNKEQIIFFEIGYDQVSDFVNLLKNINFRVISIEKDIANISRCVVIKRK